MFCENDEEVTKRVGGKKQEENTPVPITKGKMQVKTNKNIINFWTDLYCVLNQEENTMFFYTSPDSRVNEHALDLREVLVYNVYTG